MCLLALYVPHEKKCQRKFPPKKYVPQSYVQISPLLSFHCYTVFTVILWQQWYRSHSMVDYNYLPDTVFIYYYFYAMIKHQHLITKHQSTALSNCEWGNCSKSLHSNYLRRDSNCLWSPHYRVSVLVNQLPCPQSASVSHSQLACPRIDYCVLWWTVLSGQLGT